MPSVKSVIASLKQEKPPLAERIVEGLAKLEAKEAVQIQRILNRDSDRLHRQNEAIWKKQGFEVEPEDQGDDGMRDQLVLGDQITIGDEAIERLAKAERGETNDEGQDEDEEAIPAIPVETPAEKPPSTNPPESLAKRLAPALITGASLLGGSGLVAYGLSQSGDTVIEQPSDQGVDTDTIPQLAPDR